MPDIIKRRFCVIGTPVAHSKSPELFARFFAERGLTASCEYVINEIRTRGELEAFIREMRLGKWKGCNVTMPWKTEVLTFMDELSELSELTSAVNTIRRRPDGSLYGTSTDGAGMLWAIREKCKAEKGYIGDICIRDMNIVILGAGGSARAITAAFAAEDMTDFKIVCRRSANREHMSRIIGDAYGRPVGEDYFMDYSDTEALHKALAEADIVINCTPLGMIPQEDKLPVPEGTLFKTGAIVADAVYNPEDTRLLQTARQQGCICVPGRMMLEGQARVAADILL